MKKKMIDDYKLELRELRVENLRLHNDRNKAESELGHYQRYVRDKFEWYVELLEKNKVPAMGQLIIDHVKFFNRRKAFDFNMLPRTF